MLARLDIDAHDFSVAADGDAAIIAAVLDSERRGVEPVASGIGSRRLSGGTEEAMNQSCDLANGFAHAVVTPCHLLLGCALAVPQANFFKLVSPSLISADIIAAPNRPVRRPRAKPTCRDGVRRWRDNPPTPNQHGAMASDAGATTHQHQTNLSRWRQTLARQPTNTKPTWRDGVRRWRDNPPTPNQHGAMASDAGATTHQHQTNLSRWRQTLARQPTNTKPTWRDGVRRWRDNPPTPNQHGAMASNAGATTHQRRRAKAGKRPAGHVVGSRRFRAKAPKPSRVGANIANFAGATHIAPCNGPRRE